MSTASCAFVVRTRGRADVLGERLAALERFYAPAGLHGAALAAGAPPGLTIGAIGATPGDGLLQWGAPFGRRAPGAAELLGAEDAALHTATVGFGLAVAWDAARARLVTAPAGPIGGYVARSEDHEAWATHAVAAAWLAHGRAAVDADAIPELLAYEFVGSGRSLVAGATPLPHAHDVALDPNGARERSWWPTAERWAAMPEEAAQAHAEEALLDALARRTEDLDRVGLCLTAGADSRVLAVALRELGRDVTAVTWGEPGWGDVEGARAVAAAVGADWAPRAAWRADEDVLPRADADARFSDGAFGPAGSDRTWPEAPAVMVGAAGEVGRAFYYRRLAGGHEPVGATELADALFPEGRLAGAAPEAQAQVRASVQEWVRNASGAWRDGWRTLDVLYAEQRVGLWGRSQVPSLQPDFLAGFATPEVLRGLISLPLADRLSDAFHRRFVAARRPDLALPEPPAPEPVVVPRRTLAERVRGRLGRRPAPAPAPRPEVNPFLADFWGARPAASAAIADAVGDPLLTGVVGAAWCEAARTGFLRGESAATQRSLLACGPVLLARALRELR